MVPPGTATAACVQAGQPPAAPCNPAASARAAATAPPWPPVPSDPARLRTCGTPIDSACSAVMPAHGWCSSSLAGDGGMTVTRHARVWPDSTALIAAYALSFPPENSAATLTAGRREGRQISRAAGREGGREDGSGSAQVAVRQAPRAASSGRRRALRPRAAASSPCRRPAGELYSQVGQTSGPCRAPPPPHTRKRNTDAGRRPAPRPAFISPLVTRIPPPVPVALP